MNCSILSLALIVISACPSGQRIWTFEAPAHDFGRVVTGEPVRHEFRFRNDGDRPLAIGEVKAACGCATAGDYKKSIPPGETGKVPVSLDTKKVAGKVRKIVEVTTNDPKRPTVRLQLAGEVVPPVQVDPPAAAFGALKEDGKQTRVLRIVNNTAKPLKLGPVKHSGAKLVTELKTVKPGKEYELAVTALPPFAIGSLRGVILLQTNLPEMKILFVQVTGYRTEPVSVTPKVILLPSPATANTQRQIFVRRTNRRLLKVSELTVSGGRLRVALAANPLAGHIQRIVVTAPPGYELPKGGERISFKTDDPAMPECTVRVVSGSTVAKGVFAHEQP